jgi:hypothetical protein
VFLPAHSDVLNYHSISSYRPLDLFLVGRREGRLHRPIHHHFNNVRKDSIFIDFVTRTQGARSARDEFQMLASTQAKAKATLCYQPSDRPRFAGRSPFMERWVHAWASGCTVFGTRPTGTGVSRLMNWEEAAFDLPDASDAAIELIETVLEDDHALAARRRRNVREALGRHDTRYRLRDLLHQLDVDLPAPLEQGLARLARRISEIDAGGSGESGGSGSPAGTGAAARDMS